MSAIEVTHDAYHEGARYHPVGRLPDHPERAVWPIGLLRITLNGQELWAAEYWDGGTWAARTLGELDRHLSMVRHLYRLVRVVDGRGR